MERTKTFVNAGRVYPADLNAIEDRAAEMLEGTAAALPSSHYAGRFYRATDTGTLFLDSGTIWQSVGKFTVKTSAISITAAGNELIKMTASATVSLPAASATNTTVGVFSTTGGVTVKTTGGEKILGGGIEATSLTLNENQCVVVQYDGTNYLVVSGVPAGYIAPSMTVSSFTLVGTSNSYSALTERVSGTEYEPSPTRPAFVMIAGEAAATLVSVFVGGVQLAVDGGGATRTASFWVSPKAKWKANTHEALAFKSSYLIL